VDKVVYAEDVVAGTAYDLGSYAVTMDEVLEFSRQWDPHDIHDEQAGVGHFGGTIASGLYSMAILQRLAILNVYRHWAILAGRRISDVSFRAPARPGMTLHGSLVIDSIDMRDDTRALITVSKTLANEGAVILTSTHEFYMFRRPRSLAVESPGGE